LPVTKIKGKLGYLKYEANTAFAPKEYQKARVFVYLYLLTKLLAYVLLKNPDF
jgi:hypothetical protein